MPSKTSSNAALGAGYLAAGAGSGVICTAEDKSFTCKLKRFVSSVQGIVFILLALYIAYYVIVNRKTIFN